MGALFSRGAAARFSSEAYDNLHYELLRAASERCISLFAEGKPNEARRLAAAMDLRGDCCANAARLRDAGGEAADAKPSEQYAELDRYGLSGDLRAEEKLAAVKDAVKSIVYGFDGRERVLDAFTKNDISKNAQKLAVTDAIGKIMVVSSSLLMRGRTDSVLDAYGRTCGITDGEVALLAERAWKEHMLRLNPKAAESLAARYGLPGEYAALARKSGADIKERLGRREAFLLSLKGLKE